jgi:hypothetical protein
VLNAGEIVESGTHDELVQARGAYMRLLEAERAERHASPQEDDAGQLDDEGAAKKREETKTPAFSMPVKSETKETSKPSEDKEKKKGRLKMPERKKPRHDCKDHQTDKEKEEEKDTDAKIPLVRLLYEAAPEKWFVLGGSIASMINGLVLPFFAWFFAELVTSLTIVEQ